MPTPEQFWITTVAIFLAPIIAIRVERWLESSKEKRNRRESVFHMLMATRTARLSHEHVVALNRIDIEWYGGKIFGIHRRSTAETEVLEAWKLYLDHLGTDTKQAGWFERGDELFIDLLYRMAKSLGYDFDKVTLKRGAYSPVAHGNMEMEHTAIRKGLAEWLGGTRNVGVVAINVPPPAKALGEGAANGTVTPAPAKPATP